MDGEKNCRLTIRPAPAFRPFSKTYLFSTFEIHDMPIEGAAYEQILQAFFLSFKGCLGGLYDQ